MLYAFVDGEGRERIIRTGSLENARRSAAWFVFVQTGSRAIAAARALTVTRGEL
jgi:hypothetical protein